jgi:hypothetical protein
MLAVDLFRKRLPDHLDAKLVIACHRVAALVVGNPEALPLEETVQTSGFFHDKILRVRSTLKPLYDQEVFERYTGLECPL